MATEDTVRSQTITKYRELNDQLRDFLKNVLLFEKSASSHEDNGSSTNDNGGISLLAVKNDLLLHYLINLVTVMQRRSARQPSLTSPSTRSIILRLCEIRTFIEKLRPIEQKLHYQMDKLLRNNLDQQLNHRANVANFDEGENNDAQEANDDEDEPIEKPKLYRPPKHVPVEFHDEMDHKNDGQKVDKRLEHLKRRAYHSDILDEYKSKYSDAPEEVYNSERSRLLQNNRAYKEKVAYEEDYMKRLPQTKKERIQMQRSMSTDGNDVMNHLQDASILFDDDYREGSSKKKTGKVSRKGKKRLEKKKNKSIKRVKSRK